MNDDLPREKNKNPNERVFGSIVFLGIITTFLVLGLYGYLGTFSRYGSDDYCLSAFFLREGDLFSRIIQRYMIDSSRYTNILFIGLVDSLFGWYNVAILPGLMLALFSLGLFWFLFETARIFDPLGWSLKLSIYTAGLILYFSIIQAPNLYETLYWRAGMTSHFAPLVFLPFLGIFLLRQIRIFRESVQPPRVRIIAFLSAFMLGGFSEPPIAMLITILILAGAAVWWWGDPRYRRPILLLLAWTLAGALLALMTLALAPANSLRLGGGQVRLYGLVSKTMRYPLLFILDEFHKFPLPTVISVVLPGLSFYMEYDHSSRTIPRELRSRLGMLLLITIFLGYILIAATFAPSVYGQNFPVARARFAGRFLLTCMLMVNGAVLGILLTTIQMNLIKSVYLNRAAIIVLFFLTLYPLRTVSRLTAEIRVYEQRAAAWDVRDAQIRAMEADGIRDLVVSRLPLEVIQDFQDRTRFRLNRCASLIYGVDTILAIPMEGE